MLVYVLTLACLFLSTGVASAAYYVCGDATKLGYYAQGVDPARVPPCPPPFTVDLAGVPEAQIPAQDALYASVPSRHLKVIDGLMQEMTQAEKDAVDLPAQQKAAATATARSEMAANPVCANNTLPDIDNYWKGPGGKQAQLQAAMGTFQTAINALTAGAAKTALQAAYDAMFLHMTQFIDDSNLTWRSVCSHQYVQP